MGAIKKRGEQLDLSSIVLEAPTHLPKKKKFTLFHKRKTAVFQAPQRAPAETHSFLAHFFPQKKETAPVQKRPLAVIPSAPQPSFFARLFSHKEEAIVVSQKTLLKKAPLALKFPEKAIVSSEKKFLFPFFHKTSKEKKRVLPEKKKSPADYGTLEHSLFRKQKYWGLEIHPFFSFSFLQPIKKRLALKAQDLSVVPHIPKSLWPKKVVHPLSQKNLLKKVPDVPVLPEARFPELAPSRFASLKDKLFPKKNYDWLSAEHELFQKKDIFTLGKKHALRAPSFVSFRERLAQKAQDISTLPKHSESLWIHMTSPFFQKLHTPTPLTEKALLKKVPSVPRGEPHFPELAPSYFASLKDKLFPKKNYDWLSAEHKLFQKKDIFTLGRKHSIPALSFPKPSFSFWSRFTALFAHKIPKKTFSVPLPEKILLKKIPDVPVLPEARFPELAPSRFASLKAKLFPKKNYDWLSAEHELFRKKDVFHLDRKHVVSFVKKEAVVQKQILPEPPLFFESQDEKELLSFPEIKEPSSDPLEETQKLLQKCQSFIRNGKLDYAQIYYEKLKPFYLRLSAQQQSLTYSAFIALQQDLEMLRLQHIRKDLSKKIEFSVYTPTPLFLKEAPVLEEVAPVKKIRSKISDVPFSLSNLSELDPWEETIHLLHKCQRALRRGKHDFALLYYEESKPFYTQLTPLQKEKLQVLRSEVEQDLEMLKLKQIRSYLKNNSSF